MWIWSCTDDPWRIDETAVYIRISRFFALCVLRDCITYLLYITKVRNPQVMDSKLFTSMLTTSTAPKHISKPPKGKLKQTKTSLKRPPRGQAKKIISLYKARKSRIISKTYSPEKITID